MIDLALRGRRGPGFALDVAVVVPSTGVTALVGASGSGKTSLLRAVAGLDRYAGHIRVDGEVWQEGRRFVPAHRRGVGYVAQGQSLVPHLSVAANLDYAARRAPPGRFDRAEIVDRTGIVPLLSRRPAELSGGEAQRASIARALLGQPRLLLMDEPLSGLDAAARGAMLDALEGLLAALPIPVIYVTHDAGEAVRLATTTIRLAAGRVVP